MILLFGWYDGYLVFLSSRRCLKDDYDGCGGDHKDDDDDDDNDDGDYKDDDGDDGGCLAF